MSRAIIVALTGLGVATVVMPTAFPSTPLLLWNVTPSAPVGLYRVRPAAKLKIGDWVAVRTPADFAEAFAARGYLPVGVPLVKRIAALPPSRICRFGRRITVDGSTAAWALASDRQGRGLPAWRGCRRLKANQIFLLNTAPDSLDSRYFGPVANSQVVGRLTLLWTARAAQR